jgi:squalene-hopene/tetraprenyl-beta-curcumene cyclase
MTPEVRLQREPSQSAGTAVAPTHITQTGVDQALQKGVSWLLSAQAEEGCWWGELEADTTLESDYILYEHILGNGAPAKLAKLANFIRRKQLADGGWNLYPGGPAEVNATVKAYFALKLVGDSPHSPHLERARRKVRELGGLECTNSYTRFYLAMVGAVEWDLVPAIPPELMLLPKWFFVNVYEMSSWTRAILVPLTILYASKPDWSVPAEAHVDELFLDPKRHARAFDWDRRLFSWRNFFLAVDRAMKFHERLPWKPLRSAALEKARGWLLEHLERSEGLGTIYPAMVNSILALVADGRKVDDPLVAREIAFLKGYEIEEGETLRVQPCISPVWDTGIAMVSLQEAGLPPDHPALVRAAGWLFDNQIFGGGDWQVKNRTGEPGGWAFEFRNEFFPDVDDTAFVLLALSRVAYPDAARHQKSLRRGLAWLVSMQNRDGGWGAFDHENSLQLLNNIPFADHNAMLDPSTADVTARVLECLGQCGWPASHPVLQRAWKFLQNDQTADGSWYGRWGVNYVYGTSGVLRALDAAGMASQAECRRAGEWLKSIQNSDGGFGESIASYNDPALKGKGWSTASQTAWGLIGLLGVFAPGDPAVKRAVDFLVERQGSDGSWDEDEFTGTGFPCVFYLKYHLYRNSFPIYALARYQNLRRGAQPCASKRLGPREVAQRNGDRGTR